ncbi:4a-hydroxytetrahydrobiopterin dehydratase [Synoicihabitans lomoniglobus]|uniref:4a-hydroxytetrahydrobiopterin dehydratase n=1 Tax=Synoicihabitans lomoniglobus TaxID=2909285 RepID=A0AAF0CRB6_9BACT|nr:4a-hydroxytetrahydrobiopterin dehydratase [Opitutaceae bacterium LMO-M01]WED66625.1 4a-hydroxytetrahydrobiopterin dehydratase [Opitutaceae bacterium LMO-M01]
MLCSINDMIFQNLRKRVSIGLALGVLAALPLMAVDSAELGLEPVYETLNPERTRLLSEAEIAAALTELPGWQVADNVLFKVFATPNFREAVALIVRISYPLEKLDHHPEIRNVYGKVYLGFTTHDQGNLLTALDVEAAKAAEAAIAGAYRGP